MRKLLISACCFLLVALAGPVWADEVTASWEAVAGATGYKLQISTDMGTTWTDLVDAGANTTITVDVPSSGLVLLRAVAYNEQHTSIRYEYGAWYCGDWKPVDRPVGFGLK